MKTPTMQDRAARKAASTTGPEDGTVFSLLFACLQESVTRYAWPIIVASSGLAALGGYLYFFELKIVSDRTQLVNKELRANQSYQQYLQAFGDDPYIVLVVRTKSETDGLPLLPNLEQKMKMKHLADAWAAQLRTRKDLFPKVRERADWSTAPSLALLYLPKTTLQEASSAVSAALPKLNRWTQSPSLDKLFALVNEEIRSLENASFDPSKMAAALPQLEEFVRWLSNRLNATGDGNLALPNLQDLATNLLPSQFDPDGYFFSSDGRILTAFAAVTGDPNSRNQFAVPVEFAQAALDESLRSPEFAALTAGLAGMPALEYEEMVTSEKDFARTTVIALLGVTALFAFAFGGILRPALAALCLGISIGITFVFAWLIFGHLNLLAMVFAVILVALGVDFAIHFLTHYEGARSAGLDSSLSISETYRTVGSALIMGGLTTAVAFLSAFFAEFVGLVELGVIAGVGLLVSLVVMLVVYPATLYVLDSRVGRRKQGRSGTGGKVALLSRLPTRLGRSQARLLLVACSVLVVAGYWFGQYEFDTNLLELQATDGRIARWQSLLFDVDDRSTFAITTFRDRADLERVRADFDEHPLVRRTEAAFPAEEMEKRQILSTLRAEISSLEIGDSPTASPFNLKRQLWSFRQSVRSLRGANAEAEGGLANLASTLDGLYRTLSARPVAEAQERLSELNDELRDAAASALVRLRELLEPPAFGLDNLPHAVRAQFVGKDKSLAMLIYPTKNTWDRENLDAFVEQARRIDPDIFGEIVALYENGRSLIRSFLQTAIYALISIAVLVAMWTRSLQATVLVLTPLIASMGLLLGLMRWGPVTTSWNFANFFAIPILIGISVDSGIHLVQAYRSRQLETFQSSVKAVFFSSATTMIGFGILATSRHAGIASLGYILFVGITLCLLSALTILPAALHLTSGGNRPS